MMKRRILYTLILLWAFAPGWAQEFRVVSFRVLSNDITAWVNPVRDLNEEACALIKVVGNPDFVFSTPLGVVLRKNEVGEIWLYVPNGSTKITIKHPQWGVVRDYKFPFPLESRLTYELKLEEPQEKVVDEFPRVRRVFRRLQKVPLSEEIHPMVTTVRRAGKPALAALFTVGMDRERPAFGMMLACMKKQGFYLHGLTDFQTLSVEGECLKNGEIPSSGSTPYYSGDKRYARYAFFVGGVHTIAPLCYIYEGIGFGERQVSWKTVEGVYLRNRDYSYKGISGECGLFFKIRQMAFTLGVITIQGKYWEPVVGVGINF